MRLAVATALCVALVAAPVTAVTLSSAVDTQRTEAKSGLTARLGFLVRSLDDFLDDIGISPFLRPQAARARLLQEVQRLDDDGDTLGALLFGDFARQLPLANLFPATWPEHADILQNSSTAISETMSIHRDKKGQLVKTIVHCEGGTCTNRTEPLPKASPNVAAAASTAGDLGQAVSGIAGDLKRFLDSMGADALKGLFKDTPGAPEKSAGAPLPRDLANQMGGALGKVFGALGTPAKGAVAPQLPSDFADQVGGALSKVFGDMFKGSNATATSSTMTRIENGKVIQETTRCENGHCVKETREEDLPEAGAEAEAGAMPMDGDLLVPMDEGLPDPMDEGLPDPTLPGEGEGAVSSMPL